MAGGLNWLDIVFIILILVSTIMGIVKGLVRELLSLFFFVLAVVLSFLFFRDLGLHLSATIRNSEIANLVAFGTIFVSTLLLGALVTWVARKIFSADPLRSIDRILGGAFGTVRGILISGIIVFLLVVFPVNERITHESRLSPLLLRTVNLALQAIPGKYRQQIQEFFRKANGQENPGIG